MRLEPLLQPVGPLPPAVYWRRRAVVVAVLLGVLLLAALLARGLGSADRVAVAPGAAASEGPPEGETGPKDGARAEGQGSAQGGAGAEGEGSAQGGAGAQGEGGAHGEGGVQGEGAAQGEGGAAATSAPARPPAVARAPEPQAGRPPPGTAAPAPAPAAPAPADPPPCRAQDLAVDVEVEPTAVAAGGRVALRVRVSAVSARCRLDVGPVARAAEVRSGGAVVWSTEHCEAGDDSVPLVLERGSPYEFSVRWEGRRTAPGCPGGLGGPSAGEHVAVVQVGPARSGEVPFRLT